jgi:SAM-dependent methyltransferase
MPKNQQSKVQDVLGVALKDFLKGIKGETFVERDDGYKDIEPIERYFKDYNDWPEVERKILDEIKGKILEIGCVVGEHLRYLQEKGIDACGIDISEGAVELAKERGVKNVFLMDARDMNFPNKSFNVVMILYYGFGLAGTIEEERKMLKDIYRITTDKGLLIGSSIDALKTDNPLHIAYQEFNKKRGKAYGDITQVTLRLRHKKYVGEWYNLLFINPNGLAKLIKGTGWRLLKTIPEKVGGRAWYYILTK